MAFHMSHFCYDTLAVFLIFGAWQMWSQLFLNKKEVHNWNVSFCVPGKLLKSPCPCCVRVCVFVCVSQMYCGWWDASPHSQQFWCWLAPQLCYYKSYDQHSAVHLPIETGTVWSHGLTGCSDSHHRFWFLHIHMLVKELCFLLS